MTIMRWGVPYTDIDSLATILRSKDFEVETKSPLEKGIDAGIVAGLQFVIQVVADESLREWVRLAWRTVLERVRTISEKTGAPRGDVDFRFGELEFRMQARTNEPEALKLLDGKVSRISELGIVSILSNMPSGTYIAFADRDIEHGEEFLGAYANREFYHLDLSTGKWVRGHVKPKRKPTRKPPTISSRSASRKNGKGRAK